MDANILLFFGAILIIAGLILIVIFRGKSGGVLNVDKYRSEWMTIEQSLLRDSESSYHMAILNADKLLDRALKEQNFKGNTMGERMKSAQKTWSNPNVVWTAHKLRNQIAHETSVKVSYDTARRALASFKQGLKDVGAI
jgi:hypothetical protein